jgi:hypothetical protein
VTLATVKGATTVAVATAVPVLLCAQALLANTVAPNASASFVIFVFILNSNLEKPGAKLPCERHSVADSTI